MKFSPSSQANRSGYPKILNEKKMSRSQEGTPACTLPVSPYHVEWWRNHVTNENLDSFFWPIHFLYHYLCYCSWWLTNLLVFWQPFEPQRDFRFSTPWATKFSYTEASDLNGKEFRLCGSVNVPIRISLYKEIKFFLYKGFSNGSVRRWLGLKEAEQFRLSPEIHRAIFMKFCAESLVLAGKLEHKLPPRTVFFIGLSPDV